MSGRRPPFWAWLVVVAAVSWLAAAGMSRWLRSDDTRDRLQAVLSPDVAEALYDASPSDVASAPRDAPLGAFWVHPECVACFHYLGSMLDEAADLEADGARVVFVVLGSASEADGLTRFIPHPILHDETGRLFVDAGVTVTPQFLLLTADGAVARHGRGPTVWGTRDPLRRDPAMPSPGHAGSDEGR